MSDCIGAPANQWLEQYVEGTLQDEEAERFEAHYFDCPACLEQVEALQAVREQLRRNPIAIAPVRRTFTWPILAASFGAVAAALILGFIVLRTVEHRNGPPQPNAVVHPATPTPPPQSAENYPPSDLARIADLRLPPYQAPTLRGPDETSNLADGMKLYVAGNCDGAIRDLMQVKKDSPDFLAARFYAGACQMHLGDEAASRTLRQVASAGNSPQQEPALYYLAQLALDKSDAVMARRDLERVISLHGDFEDRARTELAQLPPGSTR